MDRELDQPHGGVIGSATRLEPISAMCSLRKADGMNPALGLGFRVQGSGFRVQLVVG